MTTTATHLRTVITNWPHLADALATPNTITWPPSGLRTYLAAIELIDTNDTDPDAHVQQLLTIHHTGQLWYECAHCSHVGDGHLHPTRERGNPLAPSPAPMSVTVHDTMRAVEAALINCADAVAEHVQRQPMPMPAPRRAAYATTRADRVAWDDHARRVQPAQADAADPRRWSWTGRRPDGRYAALWLLGRVEGAPGPFRPLAEAQQGHIAHVGRTAAERVERALDLAARKEALGLPCPDCGGQIDVHGGSGAAPLAHCTSCGRIWSEQGVAA